MERSTTLIAVSLINELNEKLQNLCPTWMVRPSHIVDILDHDIDIRGVKDHLKLLNNSDEPVNEIEVEKEDEPVRNMRRAASSPAIDRDARRGSTMAPRRSPMSMASNEERSSVGRSDRRRGRKRRIDENTKREVADLYKKGWSVADIAEKYGISISSVSRFKDFA